MNTAITAKILMATFLWCGLSAADVEAALTDNLVALYQFEQNFLDTSGSPQLTHGTPVNGPSFLQGKIGQAMWLPGTRDHMTLNPATLTELDFGAPATADATDFSVSMWVRQDNSLSDPAVFSNKDWDSGANTGINWAVNGNGIFDLNTKADVGQRRDLDTAANSASLGVGVWNLVTMTVDRDAATRLYINGVNTGTVPLSSQGDFNGSLPWSVGQDGTGVYGVEFTGAVDEIAIWRRALSGSEAASLWNGGNGIDLGALVVEPSLKLVVNRETGQMTIENNTGIAQAIAGYQITSASGAFQRQSWTPIAGRLDAAGDQSLDADDRWLAFTAATSVSDLSEGSLGVGEVAAGMTVALGPAWSKYYAEVGDLQFIYDGATSEEPLAGLIEFVGNGGVPYLFIDLNSDGNVDLGDYATFLSGYGITLAGKSTAQRHRLGDLDFDGRHTLLDFLDFQEYFDAVLGAGALEAALSAIPEPSAFSLVVAALAAGATIIRGRRPGGRR